MKLKTSCEDTGEGALEAADTTTSTYAADTSAVKDRWAGKTIVDLFATEFKGRPYDYYVQAVKCGRIKVDDQNVSVSYRVKTSHKISHFLHRHEPPVMVWDVSILHEDEDVLIICKPASIPVLPCGQYRKNTVLGILEAEHDLTPLLRQGWCRNSMLLRWLGYSPKVSRSTQGTCASRAATASLSTLLASYNGFQDRFEVFPEDFINDPMCTHCPNLAPKGVNVQAAHFMRLRIMSLTFTTSK
ncbi:hypothetical protein AKJ16_DCAP14947 [Drosera capensis]